MKILVFTNSSVGLYRFRKELLKRLIDDGHDIHISVPAGEFIMPLRNLGCHIVETMISSRGTNPIQDFRLLRNYKKIIKDVQPDIALTYTIKPNVYGGMACASMGIPYIANITGLGSAVENEGFLQRVTCRLYKYGLRKVQTVFFQNEDNEQFFKNKKIALGKYKLIPGSGVNLEEFSAVSYPDSDTVEFAFIARVMREKGIEQYLDAAKYIRSKYPNTRFHICGACEENYRVEIEKLHQEEIVCYHGFVEDVVSIYAQVHCVVHPTFYPEGMSNVLLEASASARPVITTDRSGCREVVEDGVNGYIVRPRDSQDLIDKIENFIALPFSQKKIMGLSGRKKVEKEFDRKIVVDAYLHEMNAVLGDGGACPKSEISN